VDIRDVAGRRMASRQGVDGAPMAFELHPGAVYSVTMTSGEQRLARLVTMP
jgi:hypothetical protein